MLTPLNLDLENYIDDHPFLRVVDGIDYQDLLSFLNDQWAAGAFREAKVGRGQGLTLEHKIRGDQILWFDSERAAVEKHLPSDQQIIRSTQAWLNDLKTQFNRHFFLGIKEFEGHFAVYPEGAHYDKHIDQHRGQRERKITLVFYLNEHWNKGMGGELVLYHFDTPNTILQTIEPLGGRLVLFDSQAYPHEVLPSYFERKSLTGWFR